MAFPTGWGRKCKLTIQNAKVPGDLVDFPVLFDINNLPSEMFDADGSYPALNGGGDIRFSSDAAGTTQLACEVVTFITNNDPALGSAEIWVKVPSVASATDTDIYVWYNKAGEVQPAETDTYGKHNVWDSNFKLVQHMAQDPSGAAPQMIDSTSNSIDGTSSGGMTTSDLVDAKVGKGLDFDGSDDYISLAPAAAFHTGQYTVEGIVYCTGISIGQNEALILIDYNSNTFYLELSDRNLFGQGTGWGIGWFSAGWKGTSTGDTAASQLNAWHHVVGTYDGTTFKIFKAGALVNSNAHTISGSSSLVCNIGYYKPAFPMQFNGIIDEVRISNIARSTDWIAASYNNQSDPGTFVVEGTPETPGGVGIVKIFNEIVFAVESFIKKLAAEVVGWREIIELKSVMTTVIELKSVMTTVVELKSVMTTVVELKSKFN